MKQLQGGLLPAKYRRKNLYNFTIFRWIPASAHIAKKANVAEIAWAFEAAQYQGGLYCWPNIAEKNIYDLTIFTWSLPVPIYRQNSQYRRNYVGV